MHVIDRTDRIEPKSHDFSRTKVTRFGSSYDMQLPVSFQIKEFKEAIFFLKKLN